MSGDSSLLLLTQTATEDGPIYILDCLRFLEVSLVGSKWNLDLMKFRRRGGGGRIWQESTIQCAVEATYRKPAPCSCPGPRRSLPVPAGKSAGATGSSRGKTGLWVRISGKAPDRNWSPRQGLAPSGMAAVGGTGKSSKASGSWYFQPRAVTLGPSGVCRWRRKGQELCCLP